MDKVANKTRKTMNVLNPTKTLERFAGYRHIWLIVDTKRKVALFSEYKSDESGCVNIDLGKHTYSDICTYYRYKAKGLLSLCIMIEHGHNEALHI
jgi:hypothetical protein